MIDNGSLNSTLIVEGAEIRFKCPSGFVEKGLRSSLCSRNGVWVPDPGEYGCQIEGISLLDIMHLLKLGTDHNTTVYSNTDLFISDIQQSTHEQTILVSGCAVGLFLVALAVLSVAVCITKHYMNKQRRKSVREATESIYDTIDPDYAVISSEKKETKFTANDAYNLEL